MRNLVLAGIVALFAISCQSAPAHKYLMRGNIVEAQGKTVKICIGTADGAQVGQTLTVVKTVQEANKRWKTVDVGQIKITEIVDEHFAVAHVVSGEVGANQFAELKPN